MLGMRTERLFILFTAENSEIGKETSEQVTSQIN